MAQVSQRWRSAQNVRAGLRGTFATDEHPRRDEEKVVIQMRRAAAGGRLVLDGNNEGPNAFLTVENRNA